MISFEEALAIAGKRIPDINHCVEYDTAYTFSHEEKDGMERFGGIGAPVAVVKETGELIPMIRFGTKYRSKYLREFEV